MKNMKDATVQDLKDMELEVELTDYNDVTHEELVTITEEKDKIIRNQVIDAEQSKEHMALMGARHREELDYSYHLTENIKSYHNKKENHMVQILTGLLGLIGMDKVNVIPERKGGKR